MGTLLLRSGFLGSRVEALDVLREKTCRFQGQVWGAVLG